MATFKTITTLIAAAFLVFAIITVISLRSQKKKLVKKLQDEQNKLK